MPIELITTVGGADSNSYASLSEADAYFDLRPNASAWTALTDDDDKARLLLWAMKSLSGIGWIGRQLTTTQPLDWPRTAVRPIERTAPGLSGYGESSLGYYSGGLYDGKGRFWASTEIPAPVKTAQFEYALATQQNTVLSTPEKYKRRIITDGNGTLEYNTGSDSSAILVLAMRELAGLLLTSAGVKLTARA